MSLHFDAEKHEYRFEGRRVPGVTSVLSLVSDLGDVPEHILNAKAAMGHEVHAACELVNHGYTVDHTSLSERALPYFQQYERFIAVTGFEPVLCEQRVYSEKYGYAGTLDALGVLNGKMALVDLKNTFVVARTCGPQTAAYENALAETLGIETDERYVLQLKPDDFNLVPMTAADDLRTFLACLHLYHWRNRK